MLWEIAGGVAAIFGLLWLVYLLEGLGRKKEENAHMRQVLDDMQKSALARDLVERDAAAARRVRERFTR